jgi:hypothetical protein
LLQQRSFVLFWCGRVAATSDYQMLALLIGWQVYALTGRALDLGLVGLIQFVPPVVLALLIGHSATATTGAPSCARRRRFMRSAPGR